MVKPRISRSRTVSLAGMRLLIVAASSAAVAKRLPACFAIAFAIAPFLIVAAVIRTIDAVKAFDTIYVISQGGPGTASETINLYLYLQAFAFYNVGNASAVVVVFFVIILALALLLLYVRQRAQWTG